jgi:C4-dicarboxylate-specific signal transduction histidine kinase
MANYTQRVQTVLTKEQYERLLELAQHEQKPLSVMIREAVVDRYFVQIDEQKRQQALVNLLALDAPVADWPQMEAEIEQGALDE